MGVKAMNEVERSGAERDPISRDDLVALGSKSLARILLQFAAENQSIYTALQAELAQTSAAPSDGDDPGLDEQEPYMVGSSPAMREVFNTIRKYAAVDAPVLVTGESGTGKELVAHAIHERSARADGPFVVINCGALPPTLIASELFGHEKGSFTGAHQRKIGRVETANGGTVFLDEIGDLPLEMQVHLLRFLQENTIDRIGGKAPITVDARIIAATNVKLAKAMQEGSFREDLFYRLNVLTLEVAPLRERGDDIDLLTMFFLRKFSKEIGRNIVGLRPDARQAITEYHWPGNIRELIARIRRAVVMAEGEWLTVGDLGVPNREPPHRVNVTMSLEQARRRAERDAICESLRRFNQNVKKTAEGLKISRPTLYRLMDTHSIKIDKISRSASKK